MKKSEFYLKIALALLLGLATVACQSCVGPLVKSITAGLENAEKITNVLRLKEAFSAICNIIVVCLIAKLIPNTLQKAKLLTINFLCGKITRFKTMGRLRKVLFAAGDAMSGKHSEELERCISDNTHTISYFTVSLFAELPTLLTGVVVYAVFMFCGSDWLFNSNGLLHNAPDWLLNRFSGENAMKGNHGMASIVLAASVLCIGTQWLANKWKGEKINRDMIEASAHATFISVESLNGIHDLRSSNSFSFAIRRIANGRIDAEQKRKKVFRHNQLLGFLSNDFIEIAIDATLLYFAARAICHISSTSLRFSDYMGFTIGYEYFKSYFMQIHQLIAKCAEVKASQEAVKEIDALPDVFGPEIGITPVTQSNILRFSSVKFKYPTIDTQVLAGIDLEIRDGEHVALVGPSGCGKSTLLKLAMRHLTPTGGSVEFGGMDIQKINFPYYAKHVTYVSQSPFIFQGTIRDNIIVGRDLGLDDDTLIKLLEDVALTDDLKRKAPDMHKALDLEIKSGGHSISGGQIAKIALARALAGNPDILLLDEVTAAFDELSQDHVMKVLATKYRDKTIISINHRLSAVRNMDRIVVMESGRIVQEGKYDDLAAKPGLFAALVARETGRSQFVAAEPPRFTGDGQRDLIQALSMSPVFADVDTAELEKLIAHSETRKCAAGEYLFRKGDAGEELYVVKSGEIEINDVRHSPGYSFGEIALFGGLRRTADVRVVTDAEFIVLRRDDIINVCRAYPETALRILQAMAHIIG